MEEEKKKEGPKGKHLFLFLTAKIRESSEERKRAEWIAAGVGRSLSGWENMDHFAAPSHSHSISSGCKNRL